MNGTVMSGRRPLIKGYFRFCTGLGCGYASAFCAGTRIPLALMLSADPMPNQVIALDAPTMPRALGSIVSGRQSAPTAVRRWVDSLTSLS